MSVDELALQLWQITLPYGVFAIRVDPVSKQVGDTAPMGAWMRGKPFEQVERWVRKKRGSLRRVK
jgi:hypothetical protein